MCTGIRENLDLYRNNNTNITSCLRLAKSCYEHGRIALCCACSNSEKASTLECYLEMNTVNSLQPMLSLQSFPNHHQKPQYAVKPRLT